MVIALMPVSGTVLTIFIIAKVQLDLCILYAVQRASYRTAINWRATSLAGQDPTVWYMRETATTQPPGLDLSQLNLPIA